jgi:hypothetical protein
MQAQGNALGVDNALGGGNSSKIPALKGPHIAFDRIAQGSLLAPD